MSLSSQVWQLWPWSRKAIDGGVSRAALATRTCWKSPEHLWTSPWRTTTRRSTGRWEVTPCVAPLAAARGGFRSGCVGGFSAWGPLASAEGGSRAFRGTEVRGAALRRNPPRTSAGQRNARSLACRAGLPALRGGWWEARAPCKVENILKISGSCKRGVSGSVVGRHCLSVLRSRAA